MILIALLALALPACRSEPQERSKAARKHDEQIRMTGEQPGHARGQADLMTGVRESLASLGADAPPAAVEKVCAPVLFAGEFDGDRSVAERCSMAYVKLAEAQFRRGELAKAAIYIDHHRLTAVTSARADSLAAEVAEARSKVRARATAPNPSQDRSSLSSPRAANPDDWRQAQNFLAKLPPACSASRASVLTDGSVLIRLECAGEQSMSGSVRIKDGVVTEIR